MLLTENALRQMLSSRHGSAVGQRILEEIQNGGQVEISMNDEADIVLSSPEKAVQVLIDLFEWKRVLDWKKSAPAAYVLGVCQRLESKFTLTEIVARIRDERPEMILEFANAWGQLVQHRYVRKTKHADPSLYEVHAEHAWA